MFEAKCKRCKDHVTDLHSAKSIMDEHGFLHIFCHRCAKVEDELIKKREIE